MKDLSAEDKLSDFFEGREGPLGMYLKATDKMVWDFAAEYATEANLRQQDGTTLWKAVAAALAVRAGMAVPKPWDLEAVR